MVDAMIRHGGSFVSLLGQLYRAGDEENKDRLRQAFPEYWNHYYKVARLLQKESPDATIR